MRMRDIENELQSINLNYENITFEIDDLKNTLKEINTELSNVMLKLNNSIINSKANDNLVNEQDVVQDSESNDNLLGTLKINSEDLTENNTLNNNVTEVEENQNLLTPEEQFQVAFDNLRGQKFEQAKSDFENFIKDHTSNSLSGSAHYWLGELYLLRKEYLEAALIFAEGYQKYPDNVKSPDMLYKLAETYIKIEKKEEACRTFNQFVIKYPNDKLIDKTKTKINDLQCS